MFQVSPDSHRRGFSRCLGAAIPRAPPCPLASDKALVAQVGEDSDCHGLGNAKRLLDVAALHDGIALEQPVRPLLGVRQSVKLGAVDAVVVQIGQGDFEGVGRRLDDRMLPGAVIAFVNLWDARPVRLDELQAVENLRQPLVPRDGDAEGDIVRRNAFHQPPERDELDSVVEDADEGGPAQRVVPVDDGVQQRLADGFLGIVRHVDPLQPLELRAKPVEPVDVLVRAVQLPQHRSAQLTPIAEHRLLPPLEHGELYGMRALVGQEERQVGAHAILGDKAERTPLSFPKRQPRLLERRLRFAEREALLERSGALVASPIRFPDHLQYGRLRSGHGGRALANVDACRTDALVCKIVRAGSSFLNLDDNDGLVLDFPRAARHVHRHVGLDGVAKRVLRAKDGPVDVVDAYDPSRIVDADEDGAPVRVREGDDGLLDVVDVRFLELGRLIFSSHLLISLLYLTLFYYILTNLTLF